MLTFENIRSFECSKNEYGIKIDAVCEIRLVRFGV